MDFVLIDKIILIFNVATGLWLAFWVLSTNWKSGLHRVYFFLTTVMLLYLIISYFSHYSADSFAILILKRWFLAIVCWFVICSNFYSIYFPHKTKLIKLIDYPIFISEIIFFILILFTDVIVRGIKIEKWGTDIIFGPGQQVYFGTMIVFCLFIVGRVYKKYFDIPPSLKKSSTYYFLIGTSIFFIANAITNMIFPGWISTYKYHSVGDYSALFLLGFAAYAILRKQLFGIRTVLATFSLAMVTILIVLNVFVLIQDSSFRILKTITLLPLFCSIYLLFKSVNKEVKQREELEQINKGIKIYTEELLREKNILKKEVIEKLERLHRKVEELEEITGM